MVELIIAVAVSTLLIGGIGSVTFVASQGTALTGPTANTIEASRVLQELTDEIRYAIFVTDRAANMIQFAVADRDGDERPDVIRYEWSGVPGDPLTRTFNHGAAKTIARNVHQFDLSYATQQTSEDIPGVEVESSEAVLIEHTASSSPSQVDITTSSWIGQYFHPDDFSPPLPADARSWKITKVEFIAKEARGKAETLVQIRPATGDNKATSTVLEEVVMAGPSLDLDYAWQPITFSGVSGLSPKQGHCLTLKFLKDDPSATIQHEASVGSGGRLHSQDSGATWNDHSPESLFYKIHGTYMAPGKAITIDRNYLTGVDVAMRIGDSAYSQIATGVNLLNTPELLSAFWKLDFDEDPRTVDADFDGVADWEDTYEAAFDPATLNGGIWYTPPNIPPSRSTLTQAPDNNFDKPTTVNIRYRATSVGGWGTVFCINVDNSGDRCSPLTFDLSKPNANVQELWLGEDVNGLLWNDVYQIPPNDFVDLRLVINPPTDSYSVFINGVFMDTFAYERGCTVPTPALVRMYSEGNFGEFDSVSIRVSE